MPVELKFPLRSLTHSQEGVSMELTRIEQEREVVGQAAMHIPNLQRNGCPSNPLTPQMARMGGPYLDRLEEPISDLS